MTETTTPPAGTSARTLSAIESTFRDAGYGASVVQPMGCDYLVARIVTNDADITHDAPAMCELLVAMRPLIRANGFTFVVSPAPCAQRYHVRLQAL